MQRSLLRAFRALSAAVGLAMGTAPALATPTYEFAFKLFVDELSGTCPPPEWGGVGFGCNAKEGDVWTGQFTLGVDPSSLPDGGLSTPFLSMRLVTGDAVWDHCALNGSCVREAANELEGYRDVVGPDYFNQNGPGFWVAGGELVGFSAGFYGFGDFSFIDFDYTFSPGAGLFTALDLHGRVADGRYVIQRVPEPPLFALAILAVGATGVAARRGRPAQTP